ncbi:nickel pincer cofactor biosynthesis protein LarC [Butyrivibrio sp. AE3004]|uniref:nickel pincer cofactor biosynthesis protein LarC n=1 Tax=Butyrivibrio sp. AE3004 TaxID=1506994 RepID=UPI00049488C4|nr:nickel pincer cofactor biosynthesis protein LarC [Butyrivibrio sp. AE3004]
MKTLYIECKMGVAGDMLCAALLELCEDRERVLRKLEDMGIPGVTFSLLKSEKCGITGSHLEVKVNGEEEESIDVDGHEHDHGGHHHHAHDHDSDHHHDHGADHHHGHHHHRGLTDIENIVNSLKADDEVKSDIMDIYKLIAEAESKVHGREVSEIHFHEVGSMDAVADIAATCFIIHELKPDKVIASPIHVGSGQVKCAHGILPVPAPATAFLLRGIPSYSKDVKGELCTPTGAAIVKFFATKFGPQPVMSVEKIGYGMGKKDFPQANCVRVMLGDTTAFDDVCASENKAFCIDESSSLQSMDISDEEINSTPTDTITELVCNLDDMTPERIGFATERLMEEGAVDVFTTPIGMKKNRPGIMLTVLCRESMKDDLVRSIFKYTTTIGIRESICKRYILNRDEKKIKTPEGDIRVKCVYGYGTHREKQEYDDLARIARQKGTSIK